jgi:ankyrin repeat protein
MLMQRLLMMIAISFTCLVSMDIQKTSIDVRRLFWALKYDKSHEVNYLLSDKMDVNFKFTYIDRQASTLFKKVTPLIVASLFGSITTVKLLLKRPGIKTYERDHKYGDTALIWASRCGRDKVVRALIDAGANPFLKNKRQLSALQEAKKSLLNTYALGYSQNFETIIRDLEMARQIQRKEKSDIKKLTQ